jgi:hypothetical protein
MKALGLFVVSTIWTLTCVPNACATIVVTDGSSATGILDLNVPGRGVFDVDFVFDTYPNLFGPTLSLPPVFLGDPTGSTLASNAMLTALNGHGGVTSFKDDVGGTVVTDASVIHTFNSPNVIVDSIVFSNQSQTFVGPLGQLAFTPTVAFMNAVFSAVPEPGAWLLMSAVTLVVLGPRLRGRATSQTSA